jgi:hypothetical protein
VCHDSPLPANFSGGSRPTANDDKPSPETVAQHYFCRPRSIRACLSRMRGRPASPVLRGDRRGNPPVLPDRSRPPTSRCATPCSPDTSCAPGTGRSRARGLGIADALPAVAHRHGRGARETYPGLDPDRASFTTALQTARDQLVTAQGIDPTAAVDRLGMIGRAVLAPLLPTRRLRYGNRNVKCTTSRYHARDDGRPAHSTNMIAIDIAVHTLPPQPTPSGRPRHPFRHHPPAPSKPNTPPGPTRRQLVTALLRSQLRRARHGFELAEKLRIKQHNMLTQLSEWPRLGLSAAPALAPTPWTPNWPPD